MKAVLFLLLSVITASIGQVLFKKGVIATGEISLNGYIFKEMAKLIINPIILTGLIFYAISTMLWLVALSKTTLNFAYPFTSLTFVFVMLSSKIIFMEKIPNMRFVGISIIILGIILSSIAER